MVLTMGSTLVFKLLRSQNGDATDYGLRFGEEPVVLRVSLATY
jgi:hypothetical protein